MFRPIARLLSALCVFATFGGLPALAQNARITGQVTDAQGAAIPGALVQVMNQDSKGINQATTNESGSYTVAFLAAGRYRVTIQADGFRMVTSNDISLSDTQAFIFNAQLTIGPSNSEVRVEGNSITTVQTETSEITGTITQREVLGLMLNGRSFTQLLPLVAGVSNQTGQDEARVGATGSVSYSVNGGRTEYNSFQVDGSETMNSGLHKDATSLIVTPSIDAIQEVKVLTSNYGAMYPSTGNATTIVTTKSGTDELHGSLYEFMRNEAFNAKGFFDIGDRAPLYRRHDFGGTIGGPVVLPGLYRGKGRTHFFFSEEARLEKDPYPFRQAVPSLAERTGDFNEVCPTYPPGQWDWQHYFDRSKYPDCPGPWGYAYPSNRAPVSPLAAALLDTGIIPAPNATRGCNQGAAPVGSCYLKEVSLPTYYREELFKIDHAITDKTQVSFRYIHDEWDATTPVPQWSAKQNSFPTIQNRFYGPGRSLVAQLTTTFSTSLANTFVASYTNSYITLSDTAATGVTLERPAALQTGMGYLFNNGFGGKIPGIVIAGNNAEYGGAGFVVDSSYMPWKHTNPVYSLSDNVTKVAGKHNLQFGGQWIAFQRNQINGPVGAATGNVQGLLTFSNRNSFASSGNAFADFLSMSAISAFQQDSAQTKYYQRYQIAEPYFQDDWKVTRRLTLNLGVRLSLFGNFRERYQRAYNWDPSAYSRELSESVRVNGSGMLIDVRTDKPIPLRLPGGAVNPVVVNGVVPCGRNGCMRGHLVNPSPRIGLAWDPRGNGKTAIRAGYGIFFEHGTGDEANTGSLEGSAPVVLSMTQLGTSAKCIGMVDPSCSSTPGPFPINVTSIPTKAVWPYVQQWSFSVQQQLPAHALVTLGYVGSKGTHLPTQLQLNQLRPVPASVNPFRPGEPILTYACRHFQEQPPGGTFDSIGYRLLDGRIIYPTQPGYTNMQAACYGEGMGGSTPASLVNTYVGLGQIYSLQNIANSKYHSFQATLRQAYGPLLLGAAYTYSHSIDDSSDRFDATFVNSYDLKSNRTSSNFDQRHLLHISSIYRLPLLRIVGTSEWTRAVFGNWELSGIALLESGIPFTVVNGGSPNGVSVNDNAGVANGLGASSYPDLVGNPQAPPPAAASVAFGPLLLNPGAFAAPRGLTFGNAGRNALNNPHRWNFDAALKKDFRLPRETSLELRAEVFNVFNHTQFMIYDPSLGTRANNTVSCYGNEKSPGATAQYSADAPSCLLGSAFLHPVSAHRPRTIQFALKYVF